MSYPTNVLVRYFKDVLGLDQILVSSKYVESSSDSVTVPPHWTQWGENSDPIVILSLISSPEQSLLRSPQKELFEKMFSAMKLGVSNPLVIEGALSGDFRQLAESQLVDLPTKAGLVFCPSSVEVPEIFGQLGIWERFAGIRWMATYHPACLLTDPQLKKSTWEHLQLVMQEVS